MIRVYHNPRFLTAYDGHRPAEVPDMAKCRRVATINTDNLNLAYAWTQNAEVPWWTCDCSDMVAHGSPPFRSTSMGDVMVHHNEIYVVAPYGFQTIGSFILDVVEGRKEASCL